MCDENEPTMRGASLIPIASASDTFNTHTKFERMENKCLIGAAVAFITYTREDI